MAIEVTDEAAEVDHLEDTGRVDRQLRRVRVTEEIDLREHWLPAYSRRSELPPWLSQHPGDSAAATILRRRRRGLVVTGDLLARACEDEAKRRVSRAILRDPSITAPRKAPAATARRVRWEETRPCT